MKQGSLLAIVTLVFSAASLLPNVCVAGTDDTAAAAGAVAASAPSTAPAETDSASPASEPAPNQPAVPSLSSSDKVRPYASGFCCELQFGVGVDISTLGLGGQIAVQVLQQANVRVGVNLFDYRGTLSDDGIFYSGNLNLRSVSANFDYFIFRSIHVSPGLLIYDGNNARETALVPGGQSFVIGNATYESSTASPVAANAAVDFNKVAPELLLGIGNLGPRARERHRWSIDLDAGVAYQGSPKVSLGLSGFACAPPNSAGPSCANAATNPSVQSNVQAQEAKLTRALSAFRFYPVILIGIGYTF